ncbi:MAG: RagB/SusD family nutrient uptake outer membrane protein [Gemmatimonadaceae bacterium]
MRTFMHNVIAPRARSRGITAGVVLLALGACSSILDVKNPNNVPESALENPASADAQANGTLASLVRMLSGTTVPYAVATDELDWIGSRDAWLDLETGGLGNYLNEFTDGAFPNVGTARYLADQTIVNLEAFDKAGKLVNRQSLARAYLYAAVTYASIADMYDDFAFSSKTTPAAPVGRANMSKLYDTAISYLDKALVIATASTDRYNITAYRARVKHAKGVWSKISPKGTVNTASPLVNDAGAVADANAALALAGGDAKFNLVNNLEATAGINIWFEVNGRNEHRVGAAYTNLKDPISGATDPTTTASLAAFKAFGTQSGTLWITSNRELRLILAEAALAAGNTAEFTAQINTVRALDGKPAYAAQIPAQQMLVYERQAQLWLMRRRLEDMYRFGLTDPKWSNNPNFESAFTVKGLLFPIPNVERLGNPCIENPSKCSK